MMMIAEHFGEGGSGELRPVGRSSASSDSIKQLQGLRLDPSPHYFRRDVAARACCRIAFGVEGLADRAHSQRSKTSLRCEIARRRQ
ncbi:unnamed protein product [Lampetra fluviatilis]